MEQGSDGKGIFLIILIVLLISPIDLLPGSSIDDIAYIIGIIMQGKNMLSGGE